MADAVLSVKDVFEIQIPGRLKAKPDLIAKINAELGTTAMVITHNAAISGMADRVLRLGNGRIVGEEKPARKLTPAEISW